MITFKTVELRADFIFVVGEAGERLPFQVDDAARAEEATEPEETPLPRVNLDTRLNNRVVDLRTPANQAIFRLQSGVLQIAREFLQKLDFMEIHTPKLISAASEDGANVFKVTYFKSDAFLAQSPQFYKQMSICADFERVYEVGPVFRAENSFTHRHMTEFTGVDMEMTFRSDYHEFVDVLGKLLNYVFENLPKRYAKEIAAVRAQYPSSEFAFCEKPLVLNYREGVSMFVKLEWRWKIMKT
jgi:aspartyl/asparaginyl-tRNA synthetase